MSLQNATTIDLITTSLDGVEHGVELHILDIVDPWVTVDEVKRFRLLINKLTSYLLYACSEEFKTAYPQTSADKVLIRVLWNRTPNEAMEQITALSPKGDPAYRIPVTYENIDKFMERYFSQRKSDNVMISDPPSGLLH